jgi:hypothetical protein
MNPTNAVVLTGVTVLLGKWSANQPINVRIVVGITGAALGLSVISEVNEGLASKISVLMLIGAAFMYVPAIAKKAGLTSGASGTGLGPGSSFKNGKSGGGGGGGGGNSW